MTQEDFHELCQLIRLDNRKRSGVAAACVGKDRFDSYVRAKSTMRPELRRVAEPYHCWACHGWHIGNRGPSRRRRIEYQRRRQA